MSFNIFNIFLFLYYTLYSCIFYHIIYYFFYFFLFFLFYNELCHISSHFGILRLNIQINHENLPTSLGVLLVSSQNVSANPFRDEIRSRYTTSFPGLLQRGSLLFSLPVSICMICKKRFSSCQKL